MAFWRFSSEKTQCHCRWGRFSFDWWCQNTIDYFRTGTHKEIVMNLMNWNQNWKLS
jgi:hypothetical protein